MEKEKRDGAASFNGVMQLHHITGNGMTWHALHDFTNSYRTQRKKKKNQNENENKTIKWISHKRHIKIV